MKPKGWMLTLGNGESKIVKLLAVGAMAQKLQVAKTDSKRINDQNLQNLMTTWKAPEILIGEKPSTWARVS